MFTGNLSSSPWCNEGIQCISVERSQIMDKQTHIYNQERKLFQRKQSIFTLSLLVPYYPLTATISDGSQNSPHKHLRFIHTAFAKLWQLEEKHLEGGLGIHLVYNLLTWQCIHGDSERGNGLASHQTTGRQMPAPSCLLTQEYRFLPFADPYLL